MRLEPYALAGAEAYADFIADFEAHGEPRTAYHWRLGKDWDDFAGFVAFFTRLTQKPNCELDLVRSDAYWLRDDEARIVGEVHVRHALTATLKLHGGHIGYAVRPSARGRGSATAMLRLALERARELRLRRVLLTVAPDNPASIRVIEKCGGTRLSDAALPDGAVNRRYAIALGEHT
jgi:predicted acetyltransferase